MAGLLAGAAVVAGGIYLALPNPAQPARKFVKDTAAKQSPAPAKSDKVFTIRPDQGFPIRVAKEGVASKVFGTIPELFEKAVEKMSTVDAEARVALRVELPNPPKDAAGEWKSFTWQQYYDNSVAFARACIAVGLEPYESVTICGFNSPEWFFAHMGAILACGLSAGSYTTNSAEANAFVASDSRSRVVTCDSVSTLKKFLSKKAELPLVKCIVVWGENIPEDIKKAHPDYVMTFGEFVAKGNAVPASKVTERSKMCKTENACTLIYTSGTTGNPKAVMQSHDAVQFSGCAVVEGQEMMHISKWELISYLPMSHIAAQMIDVFIPLVAAALYAKPVTINFARPDALKGSLPVTLKAVRPTLFFGVPRVWEKIAEGIKAKARAAPATGAKKMLVDFAKDKGLRSSLNRQVGGSGEIPRGTQLASKMVHSKVREALGLDRCGACMTGAAPIARATLEFLASLGIDVGEVYGMSETCGMGTMSSSYRFKFGSCGFMTSGMELKTEHVEGRDKPGEGEICFRGRHVMMGYMNNEAKTREAVDDEGWMHSGDVGRIDDDGMVYITGRIKELIIGAGGENIAPVPIEDAVKAALPAISNAVMIGDKRKYNTMLITLKAKPNLETGTFFDDLEGPALDVNPAVKTVTAARKDAAWNAYIEKGIKTYNEQAVSNAQKIQKFAILPNELSVPGGELTATMKLKRNVVAEKYATEIEALYAES